MVPGNDWALGLLLALSGNLILLPFAAIALLVLTAVWRRLSSLPQLKLEDWAGLVGIVFSVYTGAVITLVLIGTYPPRFDLVSRKELQPAGTHVLHLTVYVAWAGLKRILFPSPAIPPPPDGREALEKMNQTLEREKSAH